MKIEDFDAYKKLDKAVKKKASELLKSYHNLRYDEDIEVFDFTVYEKDIMFHYNILDEYDVPHHGVNRYMIAIEDFCKEDCTFGDIRKWH